MKFFLSFFFFAVIAGAGCIENNTYNSYKALPDYVWDKGHVIPFKVNIEDTAATYDVSVNLRHTDFYPYRNIWLMIYTTLPSGERLQKRVELQMADKEGNWFGNCMNDICDQQIQIQKNAMFSTPGIYTFELEQIMRRKKLPEIMEVGLEIRKTGQK